MNVTSFPDPSWCRALRLTERVAARRAAPRSAAGGVTRSDVAERRHQRWRSQAPFGADGYFARRLATDGIAEDELLACLGEPIEAVRARFPAPPAWVADLADAFAGTDPPAGPAPDPPPVQELARFVDAINPLVTRWRKRLRQGIRALVRDYHKLPFYPDTVEKLLSVNLPERLFAMLGRTLILEMHVARIHGLLPGATAQERFAGFAERLRQREHVLALFEEYPVLARQLAA